MADIKPTDNKNRSRRRLLFLLPAVAVIAAFAVVTTPKTDAPEYRRYVGQPLPDGSRVTFLYPASARKFSLGHRFFVGQQMTMVQFVQFVKPDNIVERLLYLVPAWKVPAWKRFRFENDCSVSIAVYSLGKPPGHLEAFQIGRSKLSYHSATSQDSYRYYGDRIDVINANGRLEYVFQYTHGGTLTNVPLTEDESRITNSFQVLPPGAAVPTP